MPGTRPKAIERTARDERAVTLRASGMKLEDIARHIGLKGRSGAFAAVMRGLEVRRAMNDGAREKLRQLELERCDASEERLSAALDLTENPFALSALENALSGVRSRRAKLLGLDAPVKLEVDDARTLEARELQERAAQVAEYLRGTGMNAVAGDAGARSSPN